MKKTLEEIGNMLDDLDCRLYAIEQSQMPSNYSLYHPEEETEEKAPPVRPIVNVTYQIDAKSTPAFKKLEEKIALINGRLTKYFEGKKSASSKFTIK